MAALFTSAVALQAVSVVEAVALVAVEAGASVPVVVVNNNNNNNVAEAVVIVAGEV